MPTVKKTKIKLKRLNTTDFRYSGKFFYVAARSRVKTSTIQRNSGKIG